MAHRTRAETLGQEGRYRRTSSPPTGPKHSTLPLQGQQQQGQPQPEFLDLPPGSASSVGLGGPLSSRQQEFHQSLLLGGGEGDPHHLGVGGGGQIGGSALNLGSGSGHHPQEISSVHLSLGATGKQSIYLQKCHMECVLQSFVPINARSSVRRSVLRYNSLYTICTSS